MRQYNVILRVLFDFALVVQYTKDFENAENVSEIIVIASHSLTRL